MRSHPAFALALALAVHLNTAEAAPPRPAAARPSGHGVKHVKPAAAVPYAKVCPKLPPPTYCHDNMYQRKTGKPAPKGLGGGNIASKLGLKKGQTYKPGDKFNLQKMSHGQAFGIPDGKGGYSHTFLAVKGADGIMRFESYLQDPRLDRQGKPGLGNLETFDSMKKFREQKIRYNNGVVKPPFKNSEIHQLVPKGTP